MIIVYVIGAFGAVIAVTAVRSVVKTLWQSVFRSKVKGARGEKKVRRRLKGLAGNGSRVRNDILIPNEGKTTQIDHLAVTEHGIFVIETKNYSGIIEGTEYGNRWKQFFPDGRSAPREFLNPILQNKGHIRALKQALPEYADIPFYSIVAFTSKCVYPKLPGVVNLSQLKTAIKAYSAGKPVLTSAQVEDITQKLDKKTITDRSARATHNFRASLAASKVDQAQIDSLINKSAAKAVRLTFPQPPAPVQESETSLQNRQFTEMCARLTIRGQTDTIDGFFEKAKRRDDGSEIPKGGAFDYFICPFTGDKFPMEQSTSFYQGLWLTYFNKNPDLADYLKENGHENLGDTFRCKKILALYNQDKAVLTQKVKSSDWYRNLEQKQTRKKPLTAQIGEADAKSSALSGAALRKENTPER